MNDYKVIRKLKPAIYGDLVLCQHLQTMERVVIKRILLKYLQNQISISGHFVYENPMMECKALESFQSDGHPNIVQMLDHFQDENYMYIVFEYCSNGELFDHVSSTSLTEEQALGYFYQILQAVSYVHSKGWAHRDLSLENILLNEKNVCKLCDFGLSTKHSKLATESVGKLLYMAPELVSGFEYDPIQADIWSLGMILFILLTGMPAIEKADLSDPRYCIIQDEGIEKLIQTWKLESKLSSLSLDLITKIIRTSPNQRLSIKDIIQHTSLTKFQSKQQHFKTKFKFSKLFDKFNRNKIKVGLRRNIEIKTIEKYETIVR